MKVKKVILSLDAEYSLFGIKTNVPSYKLVYFLNKDMNISFTRETVDQLAKQFGKTTRSIIAKLSREGVYVAQPRTTKTGEPVVSKAQFVSAIEAHFDIAMPTLVKSGKQDLQKLAEALGLEVLAS